MKIHHFVLTEFSKNDPLMLRSTYRMIEIFANDDNKQIPYKVNTDKACLYSIRKSAKKNDTIHE